MTNGHPTDSTQNCCCGARLVTSYYRSDLQDRFAVMHLPCMMAWQAAQLAKAGIKPDEA